jgi:hypothetical protein
MSEDHQPLAPVLERLGLVADLEDHEHVVSGFLICKIQNFETGVTSLGTYSSTGLDWIDKRGLMAAALDVLRGTALNLGDDDDEPA